MGKRWREHVALLTACPGCSTCENAIPIGDGDHVCEECRDIPTIVISDYIPTDKYLACKGKAYVKRGV